MNRVASFRCLIAQSVSTLVLTACAGKMPPPPAIAYDSVSFQQAMVEPEPPKAIEIVTIPTPLPLPGQLLPPPLHIRASAPQPPAERVDAANNAALREPSSEGYINAMQVYPYTEGALY